MLKRSIFWKHYFSLSPKKPFNYLYSNWSDIVMIFSTGSFNFVNVCLIPGSVFRRRIGSRRPRIQYGSGSERETLNKSGLRVLFLFVAFIDFCGVQCTLSPYYTVAGINLPNIHSVYRPALSESQIDLLKKLPNKITSTCRLFCKK